MTVEQNQDLTVHHKSKKPSAAKTAKQKREELQKALPESVQIFGRQFKVVVTNLKGLHGECDPDKNIIRIHQGVGVESAKQTLFHEAVHAAFAVSGQSELLKEEQEEAIVRMIENAFLHIVDIDKLR